MKIFTLVLLTFILLSCSISKPSQKNKYTDLIDKVKNIDDSINVGQMTIHNAFKNQVLAHRSGKLDSLAILNKVYKPNKYAFDNCLSQIFGEENGVKFKPNGIYSWNRNLLKDHEIPLLQNIVKTKINLLLLYYSKTNATDSANDKTNSLFLHS